MARHEDIGLGRLLMSVYRAAYALLVIRFVRLVYHKLFPPGCPGMPLFATTMTNKKTLAWLEKARATMQAYLIKGTMRVVTDDVPELEIDYKCNGTIIAMRMMTDGVRGSKSEFAQVIADIFIEAKELAAKG